jgi:adenine-specific DNA-methyltransferase
LTDSGSVFVQIGDENVHLLRSVLDEVFGADNFIAQINFAKTAGATDEFVSRVADYLLWYAKDSRSLKYRPLYLPKEYGGIGGGEYNFVELSDGTRLSAKEADARGVTGRRFRFDNLTSQSLGRAKGEGAASWFTVEVNGRPYTPSAQSRWKTNEAGMRNLLAAGRVHARKNSLAYVRFLDDFPAIALTTMWGDTAIAGRPGDKVYVVQTSPKVVERCLLMSTDPGDLVLDPTCGSGTTAHVAEQWGRRWITIDTSRVAMALARQRIMAAQYPSYFLADSPEGRAKELQLSGKHLESANGTARDVRKGFVYERIPHIELRTISRNPDIRPGMSREEIDAAIRRHADTELLYDRPYEDRSKVRVAGRFTVESLAPHRTVAPEDRSESEKAADESADSSSFEQTIVENLRTAGVQNGRKKERLEFATLETHAGKYIQAFGEPKDGEDNSPERIAVSIGPQYGTVDADWVKTAAREAIRGQGANMLLVCAFAFDPQAVPAAKEFAPSDPNDFAAVQAERRLGRLPILFVRMNSDLVMGDVLLKKTKTANLFMVFGEPDIAIDQNDGEITVEIRGVDVYNPSTGEIRSSGADEIALWMIDTEYTGESFFVRHCYFTGGQDPYKRLKRSLRAEIDEAAWQTLYSTRSRPFPKPESGKIAVKVVNHYGDEVLQIYDV